MGFNTRRAFSLLELLVAIVILSLGSLALFSLMFSAMSARSKSAEQTSAYNLARSELERVILSATKDVPVDSRQRFWEQDYPEGGAPYRQEQVKVGNTEFTVESHTRTVRNEALGSNRVKKISISVNWFGGSKQGQGQLSVAVERLVAEP